MDPETTGRIPIGLCKQAFMKLNSFMEDIQEIREDPGLTEDERYAFYNMSQTAGSMMAMLINFVKNEMDEYDFVNERIDMDNIDAFPELTEEQSTDTISDILHEPI